MPNLTANIVVTLIAIIVPVNLAAVAVAATTVLAVIVVIIAATVVIAGGKWWQINLHAVRRLS